MSDTVKTESAKLGTMPLGRLLMTMAVPMMLSMLVQALYNIVDSIYVARVSEDCLTALSLAFPAQNIMIGIATGTGVGTSALISRALGDGSHKRASAVAGSSLFLCVCSWVVVAMLGGFFGKAFIHSQTDSESIRACADPYILIVTIGSLFVYFEICLERLLQATGRPRLSMWTQMIGAVTNIILDPFFIYGWCGLPALGTAGAAIATVIGQAVGTAVGFFFHFRYNNELTLTRAELRPNGAIIREIYKIGLPSTFTMCISSLTNYLMNIILIGFSSTAVAVYGAYFKVQSFFFMPVFGLNNAIVPIIGYNYGAGKKDRIRGATKLGVLFALCFMVAGLIVFMLVPGTLLKIFSASDTMLAIGIPALRTISLHFPIAAFCIVSLSVCQALGRSMSSLIASVMRQLVVLVPSAWLLSLTGNVRNVWWCFLIAEGMSALCSVFFLRSAFRMVDRHFPDEARS